MLVKVVEYQRYYPIVGWKDQLLPTDPKPSWEDTQGRRREGKDSIDANERRRRTPQATPRTSGGSRGSLSLGLSPGKGSKGREGGGGEGEMEGRGKEEVGEERWEWLGEWKVDVTPSTDRDGWLYAVDFAHAKWGAKKGVEHFIRKRVWVREKVRPEKAKGRPKSRRRPHMEAGEVGQRHREGGQACRSHRPGSSNVVTQTAIQMSALSMNEAV